MLRGGGIDVYPEYTGTIAKEILKLDAERRETIAKLEQLKAEQNRRSAAMAKARNLREFRSAMARVTRSVRAIDRDPHEDLALGILAREAGLSPYHFLRTFERHLAAPAGDIETRAARSRNGDAARQCGHPPRQAGGTTAARGHRVRCVSVR